MLNSRTSDTVGVVGFPRSGSSMLMAMLDAAGVRPVIGSAARSYELDSLSPGLAGLSVGDLAGRAVKLLDYALWDNPATWPSTKWRFVWCDRDPEEQAASQIKFFGALGLLQIGPEESLAPLRESLVRDRPKALAAYRTVGDLLVVSYDDVLARPTLLAGEIVEFLGYPCDVEAAAAQVHNRSGKCLPDLAFELAD